MRRLATAIGAALFAAGLALPALAADPKQELAINRGSAMDRISGVVVQGDAIVLVYGPPGMAPTNQAVRIAPDGQRLRIVYDTVGNLGVNIQGLQPAMMLGPSGSVFPVYNMPVSPN